MNHEETVRALKIAKQLWPKFYEGKDKAFHYDMIKQWEKEFARLPFDHVKNALYDLKPSMKLHPKPSEIRNEVYLRYGRPVDKENLKRIYKAISGEEWTGDND